MRSRSFTESEEFDAEPSSGPPTDPTFGIVRLLRLRWPLMLIVTLVTAVFGVAAAWFLTPVTYTAFTQLQFRSTAPRIMFEVDRGTDLAYGSYVATQIQLMEGESILNLVLADEDIRALPTVQSAEDRIAFLRDCVSADQQRGSELVNVTCTLPDPRSAQLILDRLVTRYMESMQLEEATDGGSRLDILRKERDARQLDLQQQQRKITEMRAKLFYAPGSSTAMSDEGVVLKEYLIKAQEDRSKAEGLIATLENKKTQVAALQAANQQDPIRTILDFDIEQRVNIDPRVSGLQQNLLDSESEAAVLEAQYAEGSKFRNRGDEKIEILRGKLDSMKRIVRSEILTNMPGEIDREIKDAQTLITEADGRITKYNEELQQYSEKLSAGGSQSAELAELERKYEDTRAKVNAFEEEIGQISLEKQAPARVRRPNPNVAVPTMPNRGQRIMLAAMAMMASVGVGLGAGILRELTDRKLRMSQDLSRLTRFPVIGAIPNSSEDPQLKGEHFPLLISDFRSSKTADQIRRIVSNLVYPADLSATMNSVLVTSPTRGDGKTAVASNIALALSQANRQVLLIDLSHRCPDQEYRFGLEPAEGLSEVLHRVGKPEALIRPTEFRNLWLLGPGMHPDGLSHQLASREMMEFLEAAESRFSHVVIDSPPALLMSEATLLAPLVDGVIVVVGVEASSAGMVRRCVSDLEQGGSNIVGLILNGVKSIRGGYMRDDFNLFYEYSNKRNGKHNGKHNGKSDHKTHGTTESTDPVIYLPYVKRREDDLDA